MIQSCYIFPHLVHGNSVSMPFDRFLRSVFVRECQVQFVHYGGLQLCSILFHCICNSLITRVILEAGQDKLNTMMYEVR